jgi:transposase
MSFVCDNVLMRQERVTLTRDELKRVKVLERVAGGSMSNAEAAETLGITCRQLRRLKSKYAQKGEEGLIHGNRGRKPKHALTEEVRSEVLRLFEEKYSDSNFCHYSELLEEREGMRLSPSSVGRILKSAGKESKRSVRRRPKKHLRRERRSQAGMLWQTDATPYEWLGKEYGRFALHAVIDDATGIVTGAVFTRNECADGYRIAMSQGIERYGVPMGLYTDRHTIFRSPCEKLSLDEELSGMQIPLSNFGSAMAELHIEHIKANTPQAKGRVERLWETLQDRLPVELRLLGVKTIEEANRALPELIEKHNGKYAVRPAEERSAYTPLEKGACLEYVFAKREMRKIGGGGSISYKNDIYVLADAEEARLETRATVQVRETHDGEVLLWHGGRAVKLRKLERSAPAAKAETRTAPGSKKLYTPPPDHPWRRGGKRLDIEESHKKTDSMCANAVAGC